MADLTDKTREILASFEHNTTNHAQHSAIVNRRRTKGMVKIVLTECETDRKMNLAKVIGNK